MIRIFLNGLGASAGAGLTYLYNVVPQLARMPGVYTTVAVGCDLRPQLKPGENLEFADVPQIRPAASRFLFEQQRLPALILKSNADVLISPGNFALRKAPVPQILLS